MLIYMLEVGKRFSSYRTRETQSMPSILVNVNATSY